MTDSGVAWRVACAAAAGRSLPPAAAGAAGGQRRTDALFLHVSTQPVPPPVKIVPGSVLPPFSSSASDGCGQKQYLDMAADVPQTSPGRTGRDSEGNFWLGTTPRRGGGCKQCGL